MIEQNPKEEVLSVIKAIEANPTATQRNVSKKVSISLGKTNYLLKELIKKDMIKTMNFFNNPGKLRKIGYILTKKGLEEKTRLTYYFLRKKEEEYNILKKEWGKVIANENGRLAKDNIERALAVNRRVEE
jgi:MarR family transcriptional regulator, temperature-dependent positive regulator of motility